MSAIWSRPIPTIALACCAAAGAASIAIAEDWTPTGGPAGGTVTAIAASADRALAGAAGGLYVSEGAAPWSLVPASASPGDARALLAFGDQFYITTTTGGLFRTDGAAGEALPVPSGRSILSLWADGEDLYAIAGDGPHSFGGGLYTSPRSGIEWQRIEMPQDISDVYVRGEVIIASPVSSSGLLRSPDGGQTWETIEPGVSMPFVFGVKQFAGMGDTIFASAFSFTGRDDVIRSTNGGRTWSTASSGFTASRILDLEATAQHIYAVTAQPDAATIDIWRAPLAGSWTLRAAGVHVRAGGAAADMTIAGDALLLATSGDGVLRSTDGGATWTESSDGLAASTAGSMAASEEELILVDDNPSRIWRFDASARTWSAIPFSTSRGAILALGAMDEDSYLAGVDLCCSPSGGTEAGVRLSDDGGHTWRAANTGVPTYEGLGGVQLREFNAFAARGGTWLGASGPGAQWPAPGSKGASAVETGGGGVIRSINGAASWQRSTAGLPIIGRDGLGAPHYPAALSLIATTDGFLMGTKGHGVFRSLDDGLSWTGSAAGIPHSSWSFGPAPIVSLAEFGGAAYAATDARDVDHTILRSTDGGVTWSAVTGLPHAPALSLAVHDGRLFAGFGAVVSGPAAGSGGGVWVTADGAEWSEAGAALAGRRIAALAPLGDSLIAGTIGLGAWEFDGGCAPDLDGDGDLTFFDFLAFQNLFAAGDPQADFTGDGTLDFFDFLAFQNAFAAGCA